MAPRQGPEPRGPTSPQIRYPSAAGGKEVRKGWPGSHRIVTGAKLEVETMNGGERIDSEEGRGEFQSKALGPEGEEQRWYRKPEGRETFRSGGQLGMQKIGVVG